MSFRKRHSTQRCLCWLWGGFYRLGRIAQEAKDKAKALQYGVEIDRRRREIERKQAVIEVQITALRAGFEAEKDELEGALVKEKMLPDTLAENSRSISRIRKAVDEPAGKRVKND